jgi:tRNA nucleotidyltransferase (CCA-adding enzyme)
MLGGVSTEAALERIFAAIPADVLGLCQRLAERGHRGWVVGGCVRDLLRGAAAKDWDVATDARPAEVRHAFQRVIPTGIKHGTVTVMIGGTAYEVTTLRGEGAYDDGRRPNDVVFLDDIVEDLARRDFTFNAIALDPLERKLIDPFDGRADLESGVLRAVGAPLDRFTEDGLRILRAARFAATLEVTIERGTLAAMGDPKALATLRRVSAERVRDEWLKTLGARHPSTGFEILRERQILDLYLAELRAAVACEQGPPHALDVWQHTMAVVDLCPVDPVLRLGALLHDVAKPETRRATADGYRFDGHEIRGAAIAEEVARRLKLSNEQRERVVTLVRHHLIGDAASYTDSEVRRWLKRVTPARVADLCALGRADLQGRGTPADREIAGLVELGGRAMAMLESGVALSTRDLAIGGTELMVELGLEPGRRVGELLGALLERVMDDPGCNQREALLEQARRLLDEGAIS